MQATRRLDAAAVVGVRPFGATDGGSGCVLELTGALLARADFGWVPTHVFHVEQRYVLPAMPGSETV